MSEGPKTAPAPGGTREFKLAAIRDELERAQRAAESGTQPVAVQTASPGPATMGSGVFSKPEPIIRPGKGEKPNTPPSRTGKTAPHATVGRTDDSDKFGIADTIPSSAGLTTGDIFGKNTPDGATTSNADLPRLPDQSGSGEMATITSHPENMVNAVPAQTRSGVKLALKVLASCGLICLISSGVISKSCQAGRSEIETVLGSSTGGDSTSGTGEGSGSDTGEGSESESGAVLDIAGGQAALNTIDTVKVFGLEEFKVKYADIKNLLDKGELNSNDLRSLNSKIADLNSAFENLGAVCEDEILSKSDCSFPQDSITQNPWLKDQALEDLRVMLWAHETMREVRENLSSKKYAPEFADEYNRLVRIAKKLRFILDAI